MSPLLSLLLLGNDGSIVPLEDSRVMKNDKLRSTTVRLSDSDLYLIERLQEKLGLDRFHVIRLALWHLAENESLLSSPTWAESYPLSPRGDSESKSSHKGKEPGNDPSGG